MSVTTKYYLYRHIRNDLNQVFYVGISNNLIRPYSRNSRNKLWHEVANVSSISVDIIFESNSRKEIELKETEFILLYGRVDLNTGTLVNLTNGGEGGAQRSHLATEQQLKTAKENGTYYTNISRLAQYANKKTGAEAIGARPVYVYQSNGNFLKLFGAKNICAKELKLSITAIIKGVANRKTYKGYCFSPVFLGDTITVVNYFHESKIKNKPVAQVCPITKNTIRVFDRMNQAAESINMSKGNLGKKINTGTVYHGYIWNYINDMQCL